MFTPANLPECDQPMMDILPHHWAINIKIIGLENN